MHERALDTVLYIGLADPDPNPPFVTSAVATQDLIETRQSGCSVDTFPSALFGSFLSCLFFLVRRVFVFVMNIAIPTCAITFYFNITPSP